MLAIRLTRTGKIHSPHYRIVVQEKRSKLNGKAIDIIGHYHPTQADKLLVINKEKAEQWLAKGAQASDTVTNLFVREGLFDKSKKIKHFYTPKPVEEKAAEPVAAAEETPAEEVAEETTVEEAATEAEAEVAQETAPVAEEAVAEEPVTEPETAADEA